MSGNETRGEASITLEGEAYGLRPSYAAINAIEAAIGKGQLVLAQHALAGELTTKEVAIIVAECIRAWGRTQDDAKGQTARSVDTERVGELIMDSDTGLSGAMGAIAVVLMLAATGGYKSSGERKPATTKKATSAAG